MISLPPDIEAADVAQWIQGGFVLARGQVAEYVDVQGDCAILKLYGDGSSLGTIPLSEIRCVWPLCGSINTSGGFAIYVRRLQSRQWRRTFNRRCVKIEVPAKYYVTKRYGASAARRASDIGNMELVHRIFFPSYPSIREAMCLIRDREAVTVAVHQNLVLAGDDSQTLFYYRNELAASMEGGDIIPEGCGKHWYSVTKIVEGEGGL